MSKNPKGSPFYIFGTVTLFKNLNKFFSEIFKISQVPNPPFNFFSYLFCNQLEFHKAQRVPPFTILSLRYNDAFGRSWLVQLSLCVLSRISIRLFCRCRNLCWCSTRPSTWPSRSVTTTSCASRFSSPLTSYLPSLHFSLPANLTLEHLLSYFKMKSLKLQCFSQIEKGIVNKKLIYCINYASTLLSFCGGFRWIFLNTLIQFIVVFATSE